MNAKAVPSKITLVYDFLMFSSSMVIILTRLNSYPALVIMLCSPARNSKMSSSSRKRKSSSSSSARSGQNKRSRREQHTPGQENTKATAVLALPKSLKKFLKRGKKLKKIRLRQEAAFPSDVGSSGSSSFDVSQNVDLLTESSLQQQSSTQNANHSMTSEDLQGRIAFLQFREKNKLAGGFYRCRAHMKVKLGTIFTHNGKRYLGISKIIEDYTKCSTRRSTQAAAEQTLLKCIGSHPHKVVYQAKRADDHMMFSICERGFESATLWNLNTGIRKRENLAIKEMLEGNNPPCIDIGYTCEKTMQHTDGNPGATWSLDEAGNKQEWHFAAKARIGDLVVLRYHHPKTRQERRPRFMYIGGDTTKKNNYRGDIVMIAKITSIAQNPHRRHCQTSPNPEAKLYARNVEIIGWNFLSHVKRDTGINHMNRLLPLQGTWNRIDKNENTLLATLNTSLKKWPPTDQDVG